MEKVASTPPCRSISYNPRFAGARLLRFRAHGCDGDAVFKSR